MKAAWGPPKKRGTPKRWAEPTAMSAPWEAGSFSSVSARRSAAKVTSAPRSFAPAIAASNERIAPVVPGWATTMPKTSSPTRPWDRSSTRTEKSIARARTRTIAIDCGCSSESRTTVVPFLEARRMRRTASATAVASSSRDAFAMSRPVRSCTAVWKLRRASRRPWLISGWYGV